LSERPFDIATASALAPSRHVGPIDRNAAITLFERGKHAFQCEIPMRQSRIDKRWNSWASTFISLASSPGQLRFFEA